MREKVLSALVLSALLSPLVASANPAVNFCQTTIACSLGQSCSCTMGAPGLYNHPNYYFKMQGLQPDQHYTCTIKSDYDLVYKGAQAEGVASKWIVGPSQAVTSNTVVKADMEGIAQSEPLIIKEQMTTTDIPTSVSFSCQVG